MSTDAIKVGITLRANQPNTIVFGLTEEGIREIEDGGFVRVSIEPDVERVVLCLEEHAGHYVEHLRVVTSEKGVMKKSLRERVEQVEQAAPTKWDRADRYVAAISLIELTLSDAESWEDVRALERQIGEFLREPPTHPAVTW